MKVRSFHNRIWSFVLALVIVIGSYVVISSECRDPMDFKPPEDSLQTPPPPPLLLAPNKDAIFIIYWKGVCINFNWEKVDSAKIYEFNYTDTLGYDTIILMDTNQKYELLPLGIYTWRVRAGNSAWESSYTDWSELREFKVIQLPNDILIYPPDVSIFFTDTFPYTVPLYWHCLGDGTQYILNVYLDAALIDSIEMNEDTTFSITVPDSGYYPWYEWKIIAFNYKWVPPVAVVTPRFSFIVMRPGAKYAPRPGMRIIDHSQYPF